MGIEEDTRPFIEKSTNGKWEDEPDDNFQTVYQKPPEDKWYFSLYTLSSIIIAVVVIIILCKYGKIDNGGKINLEDMIHLGGTDNKSVQTEATVQKDSSHIKIEDVITKMADKLEPEKDAIPAKKPAIKLTAKVINPNQPKQKDGKLPSTKGPEGPKVHVGRKLPSTSGMSSDDLTDALTIQCNLGALEHQMGIYATLLGLSDLNKRTFVAQDCNFEWLQSKFVLKSADFETYEKHEDVEKYEKFVFGAFLTSEYGSLPKNNLYLSSKFYPSSYTFFDHIRSRVRAQFQFLPLYKHYAQNTLAQYSQPKQNQVFVGIHLCYSHCIAHPYANLRAREVTREYVIEAMNHYKKKFKKVTFVALSDNRKWLETLLEGIDVHIPNSLQNNVHDLAILSECNHTIISYGQLGFWGAYLSGGDTVYFDDFIHPDSSYIKHIMPYDKTYPSDWIGISAINGTFWTGFPEISVSEAFLFKEVEVEQN